MNINLIPHIEDIDVDKEFKLNPFQLQLIWIKLYQMRVL